MNYSHLLKGTCGVRSPFGASVSHIEIPQNSCKWCGILRGQLSYSLVGTAFKLPMFQWFNIAFYFLCPNLHQWISKWSWKLIKPAQCLAPSCWCLVFVFIFIPTAMFRYLGFMGYLCIWWKLLELLGVLVISQLAFDCSPHFLIEVICAFWMILIVKTQWKLFIQKC